ncbi:MAG: BatD family protein [Elusimicrobiota bacterium]
MKKIFNFFSVSIFILSCTSFVSAQDISLLATVDKKVVSLDDQVVLQISISGDVSSLPTPQLPPLNGFTAFSAGRSQNVSFVNGKISSSVVFNYLLTPKSPGKYTIPSLNLAYKDKNYQTMPIPIEVIKSGGAFPAQETSASGAAKRAGENLFITAEVDKKTVFVNEQITLTFSFYRRVQLLGNPEYHPPQVTGFWQEDLPPQRNYRTVVGGQEYLVTEIKTALFPTTSGNFAIGGAKLLCRIQDFSPDDLMSSFFSQGKTKQLVTEPIKIKVLPLPEQGQPENFSGTVGRYKISADLDKKEVKQYEPITVSVKVSGAGNIKSIAEPVLENLTNFKKYDPITSLNVSKENYLVQGEKIFKTVVIPQMAGRQTIPAINFSFFDPQQKKYTLLTTPSTPINVLPGSEETITSPSFVSPDIQLVGKDIRFNKPIKKIDHQGKLFYRSSVFLLLQFFPLLLAGVVIFIKLKKEKVAANPAQARAEKALAFFKKRLRIAKQLMALETKKDFLESLSEAFLHYLADRMNLSPHGITQEKLKELLKEKGVEREVVEALGRLLEDCDFARFAPTTVSLNQLKELYQRSEEIVVLLKRKI